MIAFLLRPRLWKTNLSMEYLRRPPGAGKSAGDVPASNPGARLEFADLVHPGATTTPRTTRNESEARFLHILKEDRYA